MSNSDLIFARIERIIYKENHYDIASATLRPVPEQSEKTEKNINSFKTYKTFLCKIFNEINDFMEYMKNDDALISVKHQKLLQTCFQLVTSLGISHCLLPGLGISLVKRSSHAKDLVTITWTDEQKYEMLVACTEFLSKSYFIPLLKNIILTFHLSDYLAALLQLSFAPLKNPGIYENFIMTQEMYKQLNLEKVKYAKVYDHLVSNSFQPILIKELLVLQSGTDPPPPMFARRVIVKELTRQLLTANGLISLIRCLVDINNSDTGIEWKRLDMICKIVVTRQGNNTENEYICNMCSQLKNILLMSNALYLTVAVACVLNLKEKYPQSKTVNNLVTEIFHSFDYDLLISLSNMPGTIILTPEEVTQKLNVLHSCLSMISLNWSWTLLKPNLYVLFLIGMKYNINDEIGTKIKDILVKSLESLTKSDMLHMIKLFLFGKESHGPTHIAIEKYNAGISVKCFADPVEYSKSDAFIYLLLLFKASTSTEFVQVIFEGSLQILINISKKKETNGKNEEFTEEDQSKFDDYENYFIILQLLTEISDTPKVISVLKTSPFIVLDFIEYFISQNQTNAKEECVTIALVLLNTILANSKQLCLLDQLKKFVPILKSMSKDESVYNKILCEEALTLISSGRPQLNDTPCQKAIADVFDNLLPVRAHGIINLTKLIEAKDSETISKKHYIFCLFQEQLKDSDSYIYLSAINGIVSLGTHCTEDVLHALCKEFLQIPTEKAEIETKNVQNQKTELKMKVGDSIVRITRNLGEMAVVHKTLLLNTILCGCRDEEPLIRTSALSNLAEIALVLNYKMGSIIYEILLCIWSIVTSDTAVECRRAAVMVISSLLKGLGKETMIELKDSLLPIYRTLKELYKDPNEDSVVRLHAQIALDELNDCVNQFLFPEIDIGKQIFVLDKPEDILK